MTAKRPRSASLHRGTLDEQHPVVAFHREAWVGDYWHVLRETFRAEYEAVFEEAPNTGSSPLVNVYQHTIEEPKKFWRHCREALAKWVLSQTARHLPISDSDGAFVVDYDALSCVHFLPTEGMLRSPAPSSPPSASALSSFDDQLIRDLTFKSVASVRNEDTFIQAVTAFVANFGLARRCVQAVREIEGHVAALLASAASTAKVGKSDVQRQWLRPLVRRISEAQKSTPSHQRIQGPLIEVGVEWPPGYATDAVFGIDNKLLSRTAANVRPVLIPEASWLRLQRCYAAFGAPRDAKRYTNTSVTGNLVDPAEVMSAFSELRCAVVVMRYEHCLASGSLQLCADSALKVTLNKLGYNVMDLCASPINAYMVDVATQQTTALPREIAPRRFCSAFWDTDRYFGSMGSALLFSAETTYHTFRAEDEALLAEMPVFRSLLATALHPEAADAPLLLTLDVPYDEDLCELLFMKLARDSAAVTQHQRQRATSGPAWVDYVLVLPLWWNVPFDAAGCPKRFITDGTSTAAASVAGDSPMWALVQKHADYLKEGKQIQYEWLDELPKSMRSGASAENSPQEYAAVFDGVFIRESYTYFCTATNKPLTGVTATEVIGISLKRRIDGAADNAAEPDLRRALFDFYSVS
jgi:hypothetical protein